MEIKTYPSAMNKYKGNIFERPRKNGSIAYLASVPKIKQQTFDSYQLAFEFIKKYNIENNLVRNILIDKGDYYEMTLKGDKVMLIDKQDVDLFKNLVVTLDGDYAVIKIDGKKTLAHRFIYSQYNEILNKYVIDHISQEHSKGLDNRRQNLRQVDQSINSANTKTTTNISGIINVFWNSTTQKWRASFNHLSKTYQKEFSQKEDAGSWINEMRNKLCQTDKYKINKQNEQIDLQKHLHKFAIQKKLRRIGRTEIFECKKQNKFIKQVKKEYIRWLQSEDNKA